MDWCDGWPSELIKPKKASLGCLYTRLTSLRPEIMAAEATLSRTNEQIRQPSSSELIRIELINVFKASANLIEMFLRLYFTLIS